MIASHFAYRDYNFLVACLKVKQNSVRFESADPTLAD